ncbi:MAG TPA: T9SS type A sorting domain-containing protein [Fluviicola sp.]|nr:T9SS type A sorting domain-containing protein [Fluviicola sp.]
MKTTFNLLIITLLLCNSVIRAQVFTAVPSINAKLNYSYVNQGLDIALAGGVEHYISTDDGMSWTELNNGAGTGLYQVEGLNIAVEDASTMYIVGKTSSNHIVSKTTDGGANWTIVLSVSTSQGFTDIAVNGNTVIVSAKNGVHQSLDGGANWTFIQLSTLNVSSPFIRYNENGNSWVVGGYATGVHISTDNGTTWNEVDFGFPSSEIVAASNSANGVVFTRTVASGSQLTFLNSANLLDTITYINKNLQVNGNNPCKNAAFLPDNRLLTFDVGFYYIVDSSNQEVYHITSPYGNGYAPKSISLGSSYGIAIGFNSPNLGRIYRIDLTQPPTLYVPSNFQIAGPGPCAGDNIVGIPYADYADSYEWFVNNVLTSTTQSLNYPTPPGVYGTYTIKLNTYFGGLMSTTTKTVTFSAPVAPHSFVYTVDTTACYGEPLHVFINPDSGTPASTAVKILYNGQLVAGPYTMTSANINAYTPALTTDGVLQIISYKTLYCDTSADTVTLNIAVGPNLFDLDILPHDSVICVGVNPMLSINGTESVISYDFYTTYSMNGFGTSPHTVVPGNSGGTLSVEQVGLEQYINNSPLEQAYGPMYMFVNLEITDTAGCSPAQVIDTIRIQRSKAYYELHSRSYFTGDTVHMTNAFITPNRLWSSPDLNPAYISDETDTIPLIVADTTGLFSIELRNEPLAGCSDSVTHHIYYADPVPAMDPACQTTKPHEREWLHHVRIDPFGNIYEIAAFDLTVHHRPGYILRKNDAQGNMIWEKRAQTTFWGDLNGVVIEEMDFDAQGNPVIVMWIDGTEDYQDDYVDFHFTQAVNAHEGACYVVKIDQTNGDLIWSSNLGFLSPTAILYTGARTTDVVVDGDWVHATTCNNYDIKFFTLKSSNGSFVNSTPVDLGSWSNTAFTLPGFLCPSSTQGDSRQSYWSPQIDVLSTGEVIAVGNYQNVTTQNYPQLAMTGSGGGIFTVKYHPDNGVYDMANIAQVGNAQFAAGGGYLGQKSVPKMFVDKNDNITLAGRWEFNVWQPGELTISVLDSVLTTATGSFVMNMNPNYQMNWLTTGTHSDIEDLVYAPVTDETYLSCRTLDNFTLMNGQTVVMLGEDRTYDLTYTELPHPEYPMLNFPSNKIFLSTLDANGAPIAMKQFSYTGIPDNYGSLLFQRLAATACGDLAVFTGNHNWAGTLLVDGQTYTMDSTLLSLNYSNCVSDDCSYVNAPATMNACSIAGTIDIQLSNYYNLDSLTFDVLINGQVVSAGQTTLVDTGYFSIPQPAGAADHFVLAFSYPNADTMVISFTSQQVDFGTVPAEEFCETDPTYMFSNGTPAGGQYSGPGVIGNQFYPPFAGPGEHVISYTYNNQLGCVITDTALFVVNDCSLGTDVLTDAAYTVYPNPFKDEVVIFSEGNSLSKQEIIVFDQIGRVVIHTQSDDSKTLLKLGNLCPGNYLLEIRGNNHCLHREQLIKV